MRQGVVLQLYLQKIFACIVLSLYYICVPLFLPLCGSLGGGNCNAVYKFNTKNIILCLGSYEHQNDFFFDLRKQASKHICNKPECMYWKS